MVHSSPQSVCSLRKKLLKEKPCKHQAMMKANSEVLIIRVPLEKRTWTLGRCMGTSPGHCELLPYKNGMAKWEETQAPCLRTPLLLRPGYSRGPLYMTRIMIVLDTLRVKYVTFTWVHTRFQVYTEGLKLVRLVRTRWLLGLVAMNPTSIFYLGSLKVGPSPTLNTAFCVSAHQCSVDSPEPGMRTQTQQEAIAYPGCYFME